MQLPPAYAFDTFRKSVGGKRTRRHYAPAVGHAFDLFADSRNVGVTFDCVGNILRESVSFDRKRTARRHRRSLRRAHCDRAQTAHFLFEKPARVGIRVVAFKRVGTYQFAVVSVRVRGGERAGLYIV